MPGSHRQLRPPNGDEGLDLREPVVARAGSIIVFNSYAWHGAFPRTIPGLRASIQSIYVHPHLQTTDNYRDKVTREMIERNEPRFLTLIGGDLYYGMARTDPEYIARRHKSIAAAYAPFGAAYAAEREAFVRQEFKSAGG